MKPLEAFARIAKQLKVCDENGRDLDIIENELNEKEQQDSVIKTLENTISLGYIPPKISIDNDKMDFSCGSIGLEISETLNKAKIDLIRNWILRTCFPKEFKALEIIKNKEVDAFLVIDCPNVGHYNRHFEYSDVIRLQRCLTEEEFKLLKEVLK